MHMEKQMGRISAKDIAYAELKKKIIKCIFKPGQPIVEGELAKELGISRTPLREALQRLELEELVVRYSNGRLQVAPVSIREVKELFILRSKLEGIVIVEAIENITDEEIKHLSYLVQMVRMTSRIENYEEIDHFGGQFHNFIYNLSHNKTVVKILFQLNDRINRYRRLAHKHIVDTKKSSDEHETILEYMIKKDKVNAEKAIINHVLNSMEQAVKAVKQYEKSIKEAPN